ncbi:hypothetical protein [Parasphingopyxis marina]|uniref:Uncharacterized protein n=1 Tax=Parasphingopyxis marina TaxID=2761622 RepID=A0A842I066_9SPHN|nr:hypothetical protein [Parasphingopyxis marina]MBC2778525.1 hypothetical protein [Parasphingopyxis marina]
MTAQKRQGLRTEEPAPIEQLTQLCAVYALVAQTAGTDAAPLPAPDEKALAAAYLRAPGIARRRFEMLADETSAVAGTGARALLDRKGDIAAPAAELLDFMRANLTALAAFVEKPA